jgi:hypothetical protein
MLCAFCGVLNYFVQTEIVSTVHCSEFSKYPELQLLRAAYWRRYWRNAALNI